MLYNFIGWNFMHAVLCIIREAMKLLVRFSDKLTFIKDGAKYGKWSLFVWSDKVSKFRNAKQWNWSPLILNGDKTESFNHGQVVWAQTVIGYDMRGLTKNGLECLIIQPLLCITPLSLSLSLLIIFKCCNLFGWENLS